MLPAASSAACWFHFLFPGMNSERAKDFGGLHDIFGLVIRTASLNDCLFREVRTGSSVYLR